MKNKFTSVLLGAALLLLPACKDDPCPELSEDECASLKEQFDAVCIGEWEEGDPPLEMQELVKFNKELRREIIGLRDNG